jgi:DivIVA domain-containing protein
MKPEEIQRTDFPRTRKGYDPEAVDEHLRLVAEAAGAEPQLVRGPLAGKAGEKVMDILDLVERTAAEIVEEADREAAAVVEQAEKVMRKHLERAEAALDELAAASEGMRNSARTLGTKADEEARAGIDLTRVTEMAERREPPAESERDAA